MAIQRLRMLQQKNTALAKQQRRHMAELLADKKLESARIRVENIIRSDITTELHEILELYCELLLARIQLLDAVVVPPTNASSSSSGRKDGTATAAQAYDDIDPGLLEAVRALVYAAPKTEIKELSLARALLVDKFGKEFALECQAGTNVPERVLSRLRVETPNPKLVEEYLREIARTYGVHFPGDPETEDDEEEEETLAADEQEDADADEDDDDGEGGARNKPLALENPWQQAEELSRATPPRDDLGRPSPLRIAPPSPTTENVSPAVKLPGGDAKGGGVVRAPPVAGRKTSIGGVKGTTAGSAKKDGSGAGAKGGVVKVGKEKESTDGPGGKIPDVDELARRFAALKKT
jgi:vacuolar protein sorting-associated protein IST1